MILKKNLEIMNHNQTVKEIESFIKQISQKSNLSVSNTNKLYSYYECVQSNKSVYLILIAVNYA